MLFLISITQHTHTIDCSVSIHNYSLWSISICFHNDSLINIRKVRPEENAKFPSCNYDFIAAYVCSELPNAIFLSAEKLRKPTDYVKHCIMGNICAHRSLSQLISPHVNVFNLSKRDCEMVWCSNCGRHERARLNGAIKKTLWPVLKEPAAAHYRPERSSGVPISAWVCQNQPIIWYFSLMSIILWRSDFPHDTFALNNPKLRLKVLSPVRNELHMNMLYGLYMYEALKRAGHVCMHACMLRSADKHPSPSWALQSECVACEIDMVTQLLTIIFSLLRV